MAQTIQIKKPGGVTFDGTEECSREDALLYFRRFPRCWPKGSGK
jgi:hypothetical protein